MVSGQATTRSALPPRQVKCPGCGSVGSLETVGSKDVQVGDHVVSHRQCPLPDCQTYVLVIMERTEENDLEVTDTYPRGRIDFDTTDVPPPIIRTMNESISCHANKNYLASAILVRKTLEEICHEQGADGPNLKKRIEALGEQIVIPPELLDGMDQLRLLGNDAAHIEAWTFQEIGERELTVAIDFTKKIIEATYQYESLLEELEELKNGGE